MQTLLLLTSLLVAGFAPALAAPVRGITYDTPVFGGSGCPVGTVHVASNYDNTTLAILFDSFITQTQQGVLSFARKACSVAIPLRIPPGFHVTLHTIDFRGFAHVPQGFGSFKADYFFSGTLSRAWTMRFGPDNSRMPRYDPYQQHFPDGDFTYRSNVATLVPNASCYTRNAILRLGLTQTVISEQFAVIQLDSIDVSRKREIVYSLELISGDC